MITEKQTQEVIDAANAAAIDVIKKRKADGKEASPSKGIVHAIIICHVLEEIGSLLAQNEGETDEAFVLRDKASRLIAVLEVENGSAYRQKAEVVAVLGKPNEKQSKASALAAEMAHLV